MNKTSILVLFIKFFLLVHLATLREGDGGDNFLYLVDCGGAWQGSR